MADINFAAIFPDITSISPAAHSHYTPTPSSLQYLGSTTDQMTLKDFQKIVLPNHVFSPVGQKSSRKRVVCKSCQTYLDNI